MLLVQFYNCYLMQTSHLFLYWFTDTFNQTRLKFSRFTFDDSPYFILMLTSALKPARKMLL